MAKMSAQILALAAKRKAEREEQRKAASLIQDVKFEEVTDALQTSGKENPPQEGGKVDDKASSQVQRKRNQGTQTAKRS